MPSRLTKLYLLKASWINFSLAVKLFFISLKLLKSIVCVHYYLYVNVSFRKVPTKKDSQFTYVFIDSGRYLPKNGRPRPDRPKLTIPF